MTPDGMDPTMMLQALLGSMGGNNDNDDDDDDNDGSAAPSSLRDRDIFKCPVCNTEHTHKEASNSSIVKHQVSHGATMLFIQADCPVCMEDQVGPPTVALACGHVLCKDDFKKLGGRVGQPAVDPFEPPPQRGRGVRMGRVEVGNVEAMEAVRNTEGMRQLMNQMMGQGQYEDDDDDDDDDDEDDEDDEEDDHDFDFSSHSESTSNSMPRLLPRRVAPNDPRNAAANANANDDSDSDSDSDDSMPELVLRPNHADSSDDDDSDDNSVPPLQARQDNNHNVDSDDDSDDSDDSLPLLVQRPHVDSSSEDDDDDDDDDSLPNLNHDDDSDDDSDDDMPGLMPRQQLSSNNNPNDDSDDSDDDMPPLLSREHQSESPNINPNANADSFASGLRRGFLSGNNNTNTNTNRQTSSTTTPRTPTTPAATQSFNQARRNTPRPQPQPQPPVPEILPSLMDRNSFGSRRVHEQRVAETVRIKQEQRTLRIQQQNETKSRSIIQSWIYKNYQQQKCQQAYQHARQSCITLQAWGRRLSVKAQYHQILQTRIAQSKRYRSMWSHVLRVSLLTIPLENNELELSWEDIKAKRFDMMQSLEETDPLAVETNEKLDSAIRTALLQDDDNDDDDDDDDDEFHDAQQDATDHDNVYEAKPPPTTTMTTLTMAPRPPCDHIQLTKEVLKWLDRSDSKYRGLFMGRLTQLANGDRSRILKKSLTGCKTAIWETYLDMKSGQRILWTECKCTTRLDNNNNNDASIVPSSVAQQQQQQQVTNSTTTRGLLIWYVAKHGTSTIYLLL